MKAHCIARNIRDTETLGKMYACIVATGIYAYEKKIIIHDDAYEIITVLTAGFLFVAIISREWQSRYCYYALPAILYLLV